MSLVLAQSPEEVHKHLSETDKTTLLGFFGSFSEKSNAALSEFMDFAKQNKEIDIFVIDVMKVKGLHKNWGVKSVPTIIAIEDGKITRQVTGVQSADYYKRALIPQDQAPKRSHGDDKPKFKRVVVYTTPSCPWCNRVKTYLRANQVPFREIDVASNPNAAQELVRKTGQTGVPQLDIEGQMIIGFDRPKIDQLLGL